MRGWTGPIGTLLVALAAGVAAAPAEADGPAAPDTPRQDAVQQLFDRIWSYATLYEDPDARVLQRLALTGRFQMDFPVYDSNRGNYDDPQVRRFRAGAHSRWLDDFVVHAEVDIDFDCDRGEDCDDSEYEGLTDAYVEWDRYSAFTLKAGKISSPFTLDGSTSSKRLITLERNNVTQNLWFPVEYHAGASAAGSIEAWRYRVGGFSSSTKDEFGGFDGGFFLLFSLSYDFSKQLDVPELLVSLDYVYNDEHENNSPLASSPTYSPCTPASIPAPGASARTSPVALATTPRATCWGWRSFRSTRSRPPSSWSAATPT